jgi:hypothetical protein
MAIWLAGAGSGCRPAFEENHRPRQVRGGGHQQERRIANRLLHRGGFFFGIFGLSSVMIAARYAE